MSAGACLYSLLESARHASMAGAATGVSAYWGGLFAGRVAFGFTPSRRRTDVMLPPAIAGCALAALLLACDLGGAVDRLRGAAGMLGGADLPGADRRDTTACRTSPHGERRRTADRGRRDRASGRARTRGRCGRARLARDRAGHAARALARAVRGECAARTRRALRARPQGYRGAQPLARPRAARIALTSSAGTSTGAPSSGGYASATARNAP